MKNLILLTLFSLSFTTGAQTTAHTLARVCRVKARGKATRDSGTKSEAWRGAGLSYLMGVSFFSLKIAYHYVYIMEYLLKALVGVVANKFSITFKRHLLICTITLNREMNLVNYLEGY